MNGTKLVVDERSINEFVEHIATNGAETPTQTRYRHDVKVFADFMGGRVVSRRALDEFKSAMQDKYSAASVKTMLFGVNKYLDFIGTKLRINNAEPALPRAKSTDEQLTMSEYLQILNALKNERDERLYIIVETICSTGLKYSELKYLTVQTVEIGSVELPAAAGEKRSVYLPKNLCADLKKYCDNNGIYHGQIFRTGKGNFPDRANMSSAIKDACKGTGISRDKISMTAFRDFYRANFENIRGEVADLLDEDLRLMSTPNYSQRNENSFKSLAQRRFTTGNFKIPENICEKYLALCERYVFPVIGDTDCRRITQNHANALLEKYAEIPLKTRADILRIVWLTLEFASKNGVKIRAAHNGMCRVENRGISLRILADDETDRLVKYLKNAEDRHFCAGIFLALNTGLRAEELIVLKRSDIDFESGILTINNRRGARKISLPKFLREFLEPIYGELPPENFLLSGRSDGAELFAVGMKLKRIGSECGVYALDLAAIRDTFGARCAKNSLEQKTLDEIMGGEAGTYYPSENAGENPLDFLGEDE